MSTRTRPDDLPDLAAAAPGGDGGERREEDLEQAEQELAGRDVGGDGPDDQEEAGVHGGRGRGHGQCRPARAAPDAGGARLGGASLRQPCLV